MSGQTPSHTPVEVTQAAREAAEGVADAISRMIEDNLRMGMATTGVEFDPDSGLLVQAFARFEARLSAQPALPDGVGEIVERLRAYRPLDEWCEDGVHHVICDEAADTIVALQAENFRLAAGQCTVENGLIGDEHGHFGCALQARVAALEGAARTVLAHRVGEQPSRGWLRDNDASRTDLTALAALLADAKAGDAG